MPWRCAPLPALPLLAALAACAGPPPPRGIVLISIDTLRADHVEGFGAPAGATPALANLAASGVRFDHAYAQANETLLSHGSMFASQLVGDLAPVDLDFTIPDGTPTLASALRGAGWRTGAMVASGHLARVYGLDDGFDTYAESDWWGSFQATVPMALAWLDQVDQGPAPFFLFVHGYDAHNPYVRPGVFGRLDAAGAQNPFGDQLFDPRFYERIYQDTLYPDFPLTRSTAKNGTSILSFGIYDQLEAYARTPGVPARKLSAAEITLLKGSYRSAVRYADWWVGRLLTELERRDLLDTTDVLVVSDHGEGLLEHGFFNHRHGLSDATLHVPMILRPAGGVTARTVTAPVTLMDVSPTLLRLAGVTPPDTMRGQDLRGCISDNCPAPSTTFAESMMHEASYVEGEWRLVVKLDDPAAPPRLYRINDGETIDHAAEQPAFVVHMREALAAARSLR